MRRSLLFIAAASPLVVALPAVADGPIVIYSTIPTSPTSDVPNGGGAKFFSFDRPNPSKSGRYWAMLARNFGSTAVDAMYIIGHDTTGRMVVHEGVTDVDAGRVPENMSERRIGINNAGGWAVALDLTGATTNDRIVIGGDFAGNWTRRMREGDPIGAGGVLIGATIAEAVMLNSGVISARYASLQGLPSTSNAALMDDLLTGPALAQTGVTTPAGQTGIPQTYNAFGFNTFCHSGDGSTWTCVATLNGPTATNSVAVKNNQVLVQKGITVPGTNGPLSVIYGMATIGANNDVFVNGWTTSNQPFVTRNGQLLVKAGDPIITGEPGEVWSSSVWAGASWNTFFLRTCDADGNYVIGGFTNAGAGANCVIVYNSAHVLLRDGDPVDVDGNGLFDDDAFYYMPASALTGASLGNKIEDGWISDDGWFYKVIDLRNNAGTDLGDAFIRVRVPAASQRCQPADIACDDGTPLPADTDLHPNGGVNEGDYNSFFQGFFDAAANCDIANDDATPRAPFGANGVNGGVNEGDYNCFFQKFFDGCPA